MAQAVRDNGVAADMVTSPPGLDGSGAGDAIQGDTAACDTAGMTERQALVAEVRKTVMMEVETKINEKMKEVFSRGNKMMKEMKVKMEEEEQQKNAGIIAELAQLREKQDVLQAEHDNLRTVLAGMVQQLNVLGSLFNFAGGPKAGLPSPSAIGAGIVAAQGTNGTTASTSASGDVANNSSAASASSLQDSPSALSATDLGSFSTLPAVPDFPFPASSAASLCSPLATATATPLSLAEALSSDLTSPAVPVSLMGSLSRKGPYYFSFTLRKADGTDLGLNVSHHEEDKALRVESVRPDGAVEAWNRQCLGSAASEKAVLPGDKIVSVNGVTQDPVKMLEECRDRQLLKITVVRGSPEAPKIATPLRADASEFVPGGAPGLEPKTEEKTETTEEPAKEDEEKEDSTEKKADSTEKEDSTEKKASEC